ncbi:hypothetical protein EV385_4196 [Krasilnikovia cinnamomea]|uniref:Uncharacterized protein n=1 Tax=Krasilnikovia cinnamomea TaxID=349313 RepID=A0A4Q7ZMU3_9ACTN|nr:hypothetical protein EV385_4196 [Krasilnikovia cinnamomea]
MRSRLRKLHVDGREFTWKAGIRAVRGSDGDRRRCIRVRVWGAGKAGRALQADLIEHPPPASGAEAYSYPTAEDVRVLVRYGMLAGWMPAAAGGTFRVSSTADLALPGFAITELLWAAEQPHPDAGAR